MNADGEVFVLDSFAILAYAVAAAQTLGGTVLTGDTEFHVVETLVSVEWLVDS